VNIRVGVTKSHVVEAAHFPDLQCQHLKQMSLLVDGQSSASCAPATTQDYGRLFRERSWNEVGSAVKHELKCKAMNWMMENFRHHSSLLLASDTSTAVEQCTCCVPEQSDKAENAIQLFLADCSRICSNPGPKK
jgi:N-dimethylarginine dimethylaminohydrolase